MSRATATSFVLIACGAFAPFANGQSATPVIGYYKITAPAGNTAWTAGFVTRNLFQGQATSLASGSPHSVLTQANASWTPGDFSSHYVEFLDDPDTPATEPWAGLILDIVANTANTLTIQGATTAFSGLGATPKYVVRKHTTLGTLFPNGAGLSAYNDVVTLYGADGTLIQSLYDGAGSFVDALDFVTPTSDAIIYPGQGFIITVDSARTITFGSGEASYLKTGPTKIPVYSGQFNLLGPVTPLVATDPADPLYPSSLPLSQTGVLASDLSSYSDLITLYSHDGTISTTGVYTVDGSSVIDTIDFFTNADAVPFFRGRAISLTPDSDKYFHAPVLHPTN